MLTNYGSQSYPWPSSGSLLCGSILINGGVIKHHLLADENLAGFSNYWGLITVPLLAYITALRVCARAQKQKATKNLAIGILFGLSVSLLWEFNLEVLLRYYILIPVFVSLFSRVHYVESLFGFVLGMLYSFGGILPILFGSILMLLSFTLHNIVFWIKNKTTASTI